MLWQIRYLGSSCGAVGRGTEVQIRSSAILFSINCIEKTKIKKKRLGMVLFFKKVLHFGL